MMIVVRFRVGLNRKKYGEKKLRKNMNDILYPACYRIVLVLRSDKEQTL